MGKTKTEPHIVFVNSKDKVVGSGPISSYIKNGYAVRISRVFLYDATGTHLLLQRRSIQIKGSPRKWDQTAAGHVDKGETYRAAAYRELKEEMGVRTELIKAGRFYTEDSHPDGVRKRFNTVFVGVLDMSTKLVLDKNEVSAAKWVAVTELDKWLADAPNDFTSAFAESYQVASALHTHKDAS